MRLFTKKQGKKAYLHVDYMYNDIRHRKSLKLEDTSKNRKLAMTKILPKIQHKLNEGTFFKKQVPTINEYSQVSFDMHSSIRKASTQYDYKVSYEKHIKPHLGNKKLNELKASDIAKWQNKVLESVSPRRLKNIRAVLSTIIQDALRDEIITKNPLPLVKLPPANKVEIEPFSIEEIFLILKKAEGQFKNLYALYLFTGARSGEALPLLWEDIDFTRKEISIKRALRMGVISTPKTQSSVRDIDIIDTLMPYLKSQYEITGSKNSYVFLNKDDTHFYDIKRIRDTHWKKLLKECGLKYRPIYHTRHTFATVMLENSEDILWVSNMLGHTNSTMTLARYAKYIKRKDKKRATFLERNMA